MSVETYTSWDTVPEHLKTRTAIKQAGLKLKRGQKPVAVKTHFHWKTPDYDLYDVRECVPNVVSEKQRAAIEKAKAASLAKRTCTICGQVEELGRDYNGKLTVRDGVCDMCQDEDDRLAREAHALEMLRQEALEANGMLDDDDDPAE